MSIRAVVRTTHAGRHILECGIEEEFEVAADAFARLDELKPMLGVKPPTHTTTGGTIKPQEPEPEPVTKPWGNWSEEELAVISGATSPTDAATKYREAFPDSPRTDYAAVKKYGKMKQQQPVEVKASDIRIPVTLHEPVEEVPEQEPIKKKKAYKNAWTPEEDAVVSSAPTIKDAITQYVARFGTKRSDMAIQSRWYVLNPADKRLQELHQKGIAQTPKEHTTASNPELPERGAIVSIAEDMGRIRTGQTGKVIRRDTIVGEVLVDFGAGNGGCVWMAPEKVAVVSE